MNRNQIPRETRKGGGGLNVGVGKTKLGDSTPNHPHPLYASHHRQAKHKEDKKTEEVVVGTWAYVYHSSMSTPAFSRVPEGPDHLAIGLILHASFVFKKKKKKKGGS